jgi:hypothetical protein
MFESFNHDPGALLLNERLMIDVKHKMVMFISRPITNFFKIKEKI